MVFWKKPIWQGASILLLTWAVYLNSLGNDFHYDDTHSIVDNYHIRKIGNIPRFFADPHTFSREPAMAMYRPLLLTSYALNYALGRYDPFGYHLVNLFLHGMTALLVYALLASFGYGVLAWWGGMAFGLHPIHTQVVNYISSRSESLAVLLVLIALYLFEKERPAGWGAIFAYAGGLLSKSIAVVLLPLLFLRELNRRTKRNWMGHIPFWVVTAIYLIVITWNRFLTRSLGQDVRSFDAQIWTQLKGLVFYLKLVLMPVPLSVEHAFRVSPTALDASVFCSGAFLGSLVFLAARRRGGDGIGLGIAWFLAGLGITFFIPLNVLVNEHRLYLPFVGLLIAVLGTPVLRGGNRWLTGMGLCLLFFLGVLTWERNPVWRDELTLWKDAAKNAPDMFRVQGNLGLALYEQGDLEGALKAFRRSLDLNPRYAKNWNNLGLVYEEMGRFDEAREAFRRGMELRADLSGPYLNSGRLAMEMGEYAEAENYLMKALAVDPFDVEARVNLGLVYQRRGEPARALEEYEKTLGIDPESVDALNNSGLAHWELGEEEEALRLLERAMALDPEYAEGKINLHLLRGRRAGKGAEALYAELTAAYPRRVELWVNLAREKARREKWGEVAAAYEKIVALEPGNVDGYVQLGGAYRRLNRLGEAIAVYERGIDAEQDSPILYNNLAAAYAASGRLDEALVVCRQALTVDPENARARESMAQLLAVKAKGGKPRLEGDD